MLDSRKNVPLYVRCIPVHTGVIGSTIFGEKVIGAEVAGSAVVGTGVAGALDLGEKVIGAEVMGVCITKVFLPENEIGFMLHPKSTHQA